MDQPGLDRQVHCHALAGLGRFNRASGTVRMLWRGLCAGWGGAPRKPLRLLDLASGGGDVVIGLAKLASRHGVAFEAHGCDLNATAVLYAERAARRAGVSGVRFYCCDAVGGLLPDDYDVLTCTLFLHHLAEAEVVALLRRMAEAARRLVLVDDLNRTRLGYCLAWAGTRLLARSPILHMDGPLSVRAAFTFSEARRLADQAGLAGATVRRHWPERYLLSWKKSCRPILT